VSEPDDGSKVAAGARAVALLDEQAQALRAELAHLRRDLDQVQNEISATQAAQLVEANERLVLAALHAETIAEAAMSKLGELTRWSQRDVLTDTPNRALLLDRLEAAIAMARRHGTRVGVIFLDLDHFKQINDTFGHAVGDGVLQLVARLLESVVRESDSVSRHGGDEYLVLLSEVAQASDATAIGAKILAALAEPSRIGEHVFRLAASFGIAVYPEDGEDAATLIGCADAAMYRSKRRGSRGVEPEQRGGPVERGPGIPRVEIESQTVPAPQAGHEPLLRDLRDVNEQLLMAAMSAQDLESEARAAQRRQIKFIAMVAHELRNPLTPIRTAAELLIRAQPDDQALLARLHVIIKRQVAHMTRLVDDLLDGSRVSTGKLRLERGSVEMIATLRLAVETCRPAMDTRLQRLKLRLPEGSLRASGDPVRLAQIFSNLLDNASKYTPKGGEIALALVVDGRTMTITVSDNGIGITAEALPHIFDLFKQDERALTVHSRGLGVGLAVVRELVEAHGGKVVAHSAGSHLGSQFVVTLPLAEMQTVAD
jgi:diguanylate cyclase (GGDEF)-like protein